MTNRILRPGSSLVAALLAITMLGACRDQPAERGRAPLIQPVRVETVRFGPQERLIALAGTVVPRTEAAMGFRVAGKIAARLVDRGDRVVAGDILARLDPTDLDLTLRNARASVAAALADEVETRADFQRYAELRGSAAFVRAVHDKRFATMTAAAARLDQARTALGLAENQRGYAELRADSDGVVTDVLAEPDQVVAFGYPVVKLARNAQAEILVNVPEHRVAHMLGAERFAVTLWSDPTRSWPGVLREMSPQADPATRSFAARIALPSDIGAVPFGMSATLLVGDIDAQRVTRLPLGALFQQGEGPAVWVVNPVDGQITLRPVRILAIEADAIVIATGVADGDLVVTAGAHKLDAGQRVRVVAERR